MRYIPAVLLFFIMLALPVPDALSADAKASASLEVLNDQAQVLQRQGNLDKAIEVTQQAVALAKTEFGANSPEAAASMARLAELYRAQSAKLDEAAAQINQPRQAAAAPAANPNPAKQGG